MSDKMRWKIWLHNNVKGCHEAIWKRNKKGKYTENYNNTAQTIEKIRGMRKSYAMDSLNQVKTEGYNQAIDDIIKMMEGVGW
jgi:hypothetical protein